MEEEITNDQYRRLLEALAAKYLSAQGTQADAHYVLHEMERLRDDPRTLSQAARLLKMVESRPLDPDRNPDQFEAKIPHG